MRDNWLFNGTPQVWIYFVIIRGAVASRYRWGARIICNTEIWFASAALATKGRPMRDLLWPTDSNSYPSHHLTEDKLYLITFQVLSSVVNMEWSWESSLCGPHTSFNSHLKVNWPSREAVRRRGENSVIATCLKTTQNWTDQNCLTL